MKTLTIETIKLRMILDHYSWEDEAEAPASWYISWVEGLAVPDDDVEPCVDGIFVGLNIEVLKRNSLRGRVERIIFEFFFLQHMESDKC